MAASYFCSVRLTKVEPDVAVEAHPPKVLMFCTSCDAFLLNVLLNAYLSFGQFPLTFIINKVFPSTKLSVTSYVSFFFCTTLYKLWCV